MIRQQKNTISFVQSLVCPFSHIPCVEYLILFQTNESPERPHSGENMFSYLLNNHTKKEKERGKNIIQMEITSDKKTQRQEEARIMAMQTFTHVFIQPFKRCAVVGEEWRSNPATKLSGTWIFGKWSDEGLYVSFCYC